MRHNRVIDRTTETARAVYRRHPLRYRIAALLALFAALLPLAAACSNDSTPASSAQASGQQQTEDAYARLSKAVPYVVPANSLERRNLAERLKRTDNPSAIGYVYLLSFGKPIGFYAVRGKVSNPDSQLTTDQTIQTNCHNSSTACSDTAVNAPGDDGSYGPNERGIFFFTTEGVMVTTSLDYVWSDNPLPLNVPRLNSK